MPVQQVAYAPPPPPARPAATGSAEPQSIPFAVVDADDIGVPAAIVASAPVPPAMSRTLADLRSATPSAFAASVNEGALAIAALDQQPPTRPQFGPAVTASAYAAPNARIEATPAAPEPETTPQPDDILTATLAPQMELDSFADLFDGPILPLDGKPDTATSNALAALKVHDGELFAPDLDHVTDLFTHPAAFSSAQFAFFTDPDNADFDPATQLGQGTYGHTFARTAAVARGATGPGDGSIWVTLN